MDLANPSATAVAEADPDLVMHLAAESHVDRSIDGPGAFIKSNVTGKFNLLQALRAHWQQLPVERRDVFRFHHISTDEMFDWEPVARRTPTRPWQPQQTTLLPPSPREWLSEDHQVAFLLSLALLLVTKDEDFLDLSQGLLEVIQKGSARLVLAIPAASAAL